MKIILLLITVIVLVTGCSGPGGPATRTGRTIDHGAEKVGEGVQKTGEKIKDVAR